MRRYENKTNKLVLGIWNSYIIIFVNLPHISVTFLCPPSWRCFFRSLYYKGNKQLQNIKVAMCYSRYVLKYKIQVKLFVLNVSG